MKAIITGKQLNLRVSVPPIFSHIFALVRPDLRAAHNQSIAYVLPLQTTF